MPELTNLFAALPGDMLPGDAPAEIFDTLLETKGVRIERIVSTGQASPDGFWFDQPANEWVVVLQGRARLAFENATSQELGPGDFVYIPAHQRHRVDWTDPEQPTIWLALHIEVG